MSFSAAWAPSLAPWVTDLWSCEVVLASGVLLPCASVGADSFPVVCGSGSVVGPVPVMLSGEPGVMLPSVCLD